MVPEIVFVLSAAFSPGYVIPQQTPDPSITDVEAYAVYAVLIPQEYAVRMAPGKPVVLQRETETYGACLPTGDPMNAEWKPVVENYKAENATVRFVLPEKALRLPYTVVPKASIPKEAYVQVSAVGFDPSKTKALAYVANYCGSLCGAGAYHFLEKVDGAWREVTLARIRTCSWES